MSFYDHQIEVPLEELIYPDKYRYFIARLPVEHAAAAPFAHQPRLRMRGEINDLPFAGAWMPDGAGGLYLILAADFVRDLGVRLGDPLEIRFSLDDPDRVDLPEELALALAADPAARALWEGLTPGRRRGLAHMVAKLKRPDSRARKAAVILAALGPAEA